VTAPFSYLSYYLSLINIEETQMAPSDPEIIRPHTWDRRSGKYVATGESIVTDAATTRPRINPAGNRDRFLKGPIPWNWIVRASELPGQALVLGLCIWRLKGATRKDTVALGNAELKPFGIDRAAKSRGLATLEKAGLIKVNRTPGRWCNITLLT
jgi:hypothetical protein